MKGILLVNAAKNMTIGSEKIISENAKAHFSDWALMIVRSDLDHTTAEFIEATQLPAPGSITFEIGEPVAVEIPKVEHRTPVAKKPRGPYKPRQKGKTDIK